jgi:hypothetical protein
MQFTTPIGNTTVLACFSLIVIGKFEDLDELAKLLATTSSSGHLHISLTEYPVGWRLQISSDGDYYPDRAHVLVEDRIKGGMPVQIANSEPMLTYTYLPREEEEADHDIHAGELPF